MCSWLFFHQIVDMNVIGDVLLLYVVWARIRYHVCSAALNHAPVGQVYTVTPAKLHDVYGLMRAYRKTSIDWVYPIPGNNDIHSMNLYGRYLIVASK